VVHLRQHRFIPAADLWDGFNPLGMSKGIFVLFKGYIDESYDKKQKLFSLSCLVATGKKFSEMERIWKLHIAAKNKQLAKQSRKLISRYHASDCNSRHGDFEGWTEEERNEFVLGLFSIFRRTPVHAVGYDVDLDNLCEVFPELAHKRLELAYAVLLDFLMFTIADDFHNLNEGNKDIKITLIHDRAGKYDTTLLRQFNNTRESKNFPYGDYFTSITSMGWENCLLLQPADLVAFEIFREAEQKTKGRNSRKSFKALIDMETFGIHTKSFTDKETMFKLRKMAEQRKAGLLEEGT